VLYIGRIFHFGGLIQKSDIRRDYSYNKACNKTYNKT